MQIGFTRIQVAIRPPRGRDSKRRVAEIQSAALPRFKAPRGRDSNRHVAEIQTATWPRFKLPRGRDSNRHVAEIQTATWPRSREHVAAAPRRRTHARAACADVHVHVARSALRLAELPRRLDGRRRRGDRISALDMRTRRMLPCCVVMRDVSARRAMIRAIYSIRQLLVAGGGGTVLNVAAARARHV